MVTITPSKHKTMQCQGKGRQRGGIISQIGRPSGIRTLSLVFSSTDGPEEEEAQKWDREETGGKMTRLSAIIDDY